MLCGLGSQVSNWLGAPHNQSRMQCFCWRLACSAKARNENRPLQLKMESAPLATNPCRNGRRFLTQQTRKSIVFPRLQQLIEQRRVGQKRRLLQGRVILDGEELWKLPD